MQSQATIDDVALEIARDHIERTKNWSDTEYKIEILSRSSDNTVVLDAVHLDDLRDEKGSNRSVQLHVDTAKRTVVKELAYQ